MRFRSDGEIPRFELKVLRAFVPALWAEWAALRFGADGRLLDPDTGDALGVLRLGDAPHRSSGARYTLSPGDAERYVFTVAEDDGSTVRGTLVAPPGISRIAVGQHVSVSGRGTVAAAEPFSWWAPLAGADWTVDVTTADHWRADGQADITTRNVSGHLRLGERWHVTARIDVRALLLARDVPGYAVTLIGGGAATLELTVEPAVLGGRGDLATGRARMQRAAADGVVDIRTRSDVWRCRVTLHLDGRGVLGRSALLAARPMIRRAVRDGLAEFWTDLASQTRVFRSTLAGLQRDAATEGGPEQRVHRELWQAVRDADREQRAAATATPAQPDVQRTLESPAAVSPGRSRRSPSRRAAVVLLPALLVVVVVAVVVIVRTASSGDSSHARPTSAPRRVTVGAFAGTDLGETVRTQAFTEGSVAISATVAADDLTGRDTGTVWNTAARVSAPDGTVYTVSVLAVDLKADPHQPDASPTFTATGAPGSTSGLGAGWRSTSGLDPPSSPSAANLTDHTLLIVQVKAAAGAGAELRRLTAQLSPPLRRSFIAATRP